MSRAFRFSSEDALRVAIASSLLPEEVLAAPAKVHDEADGAIVVTPSKGIDRATAEKLASLGAAAVNEPKDSSRQVACWAAIVKPTRRPEPDELGAVIFLAPHERALLDLAGELLRLGCDRQELTESSGRYLLRASSPPYYTVARALDRAEGLVAFVPDEGAADRVFTEVGWTHPLAPKLAPPRDDLLLVRRDGAFSPAPKRGWTGLYDVLEIAVPSERARAEPKPLDAKLKVHLRLSRGGRREAPGLWIVRDDAIAQIDRFVESTPQELLSAILFAVAKEGDRTIVILSARPGAKHPPSIDLRAEVYAPYLQIPDLFVPADATLEPPLRRDRLRDVLSAERGSMTWLAPTNDGRSFRVERIDEAALTPLDEWVEYVIDAASPTLQAWTRSVSFEFEKYALARGNWVAGEEEPEDEAPPSSRPHEKGRGKKKAELVGASAKKKGKKDAAATTAEVPVRIELATAVAETEVTRALVEREQRFLALDAPADAPERNALWLEMGDLNARLARKRDAALCFGRALWLASPDDAAAIAQRWAQSDASAPRNELVVREGASPDEARSLATSLVADALAARSIRPDELHAVARWLEKHDEALDLRTFWLAHLALSRLVGGDPLGLARARDRLLAKLHRGLSVARDVPSFLRFADRGREGGGGEQLVAQLQGLLERYEKTKRTRSAVEAPVASTRAYVLFVFAYGLARLGAPDPAKKLVEAATALVDAKDPVHGFLVRAYTARVQHALEGLPAETPLPPEVAGELNALEKFLRYKVDRIRQFSSILEPQERLDPVVAFQRGGADPRGAAFAKLRGMSDRDEVAREVRRIFEGALKEPSPEHRSDLFDAVMDFFPAIPDTQAADHLNELVARLDDVAPLRRAQVLEEALMLAGHFGQSERVKSIVGALRPVLAGLGAEQAAEAGSVIGSTLRALRRVGLRDEAAQLLDAISGAVQGRGTQLLVARMHLAGGLIYLGRIDRAQPSIEEALGVLAADATVPDRLQITRALARAVGSGRAELAIQVIERLADQLPKITDSFNTNSHFCLSVVAFMESLVLGLASEDLVLGPLGRAWLDEDEAMIRRRVHGDLRG